MGTQNGKVIPITSRLAGDNGSNQQFLRDQALSRRRGFDAVETVALATPRQSHAITPAPAPMQPLTATTLSRLFIESLDQQICGTNSQSPTDLCWPVRSDKQLDKTVVDIVDMLFGFVLDDTALPTGTRDVLNRLQFQILKLATVDISFFCDWQHPARRLLNRIAPIFRDCRNNSGDVARLELLVNARINQLIDEITTEARTFALALDEIEAAASTLPRTRAQDEAAAWARAEAAAREILEHTSLPLVRDFIADYWLDVLQRTALEHGDASPQWQDALATISELEWSIGAKSSQEERFRLIALVPSLLARINRGLDLLAVDKQERRPFFDTLVGLHSEMLRVEEVRPAPVVQHVPASEQVARMQRGDWVEFHLADGSISRERLTWISPQRGILVFSNHQGQQAISISPEDLAELVREHKALIIRDQPGTASEKHSA